MQTSHTNKPQHPGPNASFSVTLQPYAILLFTLGVVVQPHSSSSSNNSLTCTLVRPIRFSQPSDSLSFSVFYRYSPNHPSRTSMAFLPRIRSFPSGNRIWPFPRTPHIISHPTQYSSLTARRSLAPYQQHLLQQVEGFSKAGTHLQFFVGTASLSIQSNINSLCAV